MRAITLGSLGTLSSVRLGTVNSVGHAASVFADVTDNSFQFPARFTDNSIEVKTELISMETLNNSLQIKRSKFGKAYILNNHRLYFITPMLELGETLIISYRHEISTGRRIALVRNLEG